MSMALSLPSGISFWSWWTCPCLDTNLKLRTWLLVVAENHKAFVLRAGTRFAVNSGVWGPYGTPLRAVQATSAAFYDLTDAIIDKRLSLCPGTSCAHSHWHFQFSRKKERISRSYNLLKKTLISVALTRACFQWIVCYFVTRLPAKYFFSIDAAWKPQYLNMTLFLKSDFVIVLHFLL